MQVALQRAKAPALLTLAGEEKVHASTSKRVDEGEPHIAGICVGLAVRCLPSLQAQVRGFSIAAGVVEEPVPVELAGVELLGGLEWFTHTSIIEGASWVSTSTSCFHHKVDFIAIT